jgi:hypothetical protein
MICFAWLKVEELVAVLGVFLATSVKSVCRGEKGIAKQWAAFSFADASTM